MMNRSTWLLPLFISVAVVGGCRPAPESPEEGENRQHKAFQAHGDSLSGVWELVEFSHRGTDRASEFPNRVVMIEDDLAVTVIPANLYRTKTSLDSDGVVSVQPSLKTVPVQARIRLTGLKSSDGLATFEVVSFGGIDRSQDTEIGRAEDPGSIVPGDERENWSRVGRWRRTGDELTICLNISGEQPPPDLSSGDDRLLLQFRRGSGRLPEAMSLLDEDEFESLTLPFLGPPRRSLDDVLILDYGPAMLAKRNSRRLWSRVVDYVAERGGGLQAGDRLTIAVIGEQARLRTFAADDRHAIADWLAESNPHRHETLIPALQTSTEKLRQLQLDHNFMHVEVLVAPVKASLDEDGLLSGLEALRAQCADELKLLIVPNRPKLPNISISGMQFNDRQPRGGSPIVPDRRVEVDVAVANHGDRQASFVLECKYGNENVASQRINLDGGSRRVVPLSFRCAEEAEQIFTAALRDAEDEINALDLDDRIEVPIIPSGERAILLVRTPKEGESRPSLMGAFLKAALLLLNGELNGRQGHRPFAIQEMDFSEFETCNTEKYDLAIFESVSQFTPTQSDQLARLLGDGTPVWLCLASDADEQLIRRIRQRLDAAGSFPFEISADSESESTRRKMLDTVSGKEFLGDGWSYMYEQMETDPLLQSEVYVMDYCHLQRLQDLAEEEDTGDITSREAETKDAAGWVTLFESDKGEPLLIIGNMGQSVLAISAFLYDDKSSTFPTGPLFVPFVDGMLAQLVPATRALVALQGDEIVFPERRPKSTMSVTLPSGLRTSYEHPDSALLPKTYDEPGVYRFSLVSPSGDRRESAVFVTVPAELSRLDFTDVDVQLRSLSQQVGFTYEILTEPPADGVPIGR